MLRKNSDADLLGCNADDQGEDDRRLTRSDTKTRSLNQAPLSDRVPANTDKIDRLLRKWLRRLPHPFPARDRAAGYRYQLSILQAEFSLTQVLDQPVTGRIFFEEVIRENLDIGRPSQVSLVFDRKVNRRTPGPFRTRVITDGVVPSLHVDYKKTRIKQYHKEGQALRTETTINDTRDFAIGRRIENLELLRKIGFVANRRLLDVQRIGHDCFIGEASFQDMQRLVTVNDQRAAALRFADPRVQALLHLLLLFLLVQNLDFWIAGYNEARPHQGRWCFGKTPMQTFLDAMPITREKTIAA